MVVKVFVILAFAFLATVVYSSPVDEQKPFDCPPNEKYYKCNLEVCYKKCDNLLRPPPCPSIAPGCYKPSCECINGYLRFGDDGKCVPEEKCPKA